jgi:hypothetical protein
MPFPSEPTRKGICGLGEAKFQSPDCVDAARMEGSESGWHGLWAGQVASLDLTLRPSILEAG